MNQTPTRILALVIFGLLRSATVVGADGNAVPENVVTIHNIPYRQQPSNSWMLDLAMPREKTNKPRAAIVVIHGGGWIEGDKSSFSVREKRMPGKDLKLQPDEPWREYSSRVQAAVSDSGPVDLVHQYKQETLKPVVNEFFLRTLKMKE